MTDERIHLHVSVDGADPIAMTAPLVVTGALSTLVDADGTRLRLGPEGTVVVVSGADDPFGAYRVLRIDGEGLVASKPDGSVGIYEAGLGWGDFLLFAPFALQVVSRREPKSDWSPEAGLVRSFVEPYVIESWPADTAARAESLGPIRLVEFRKERRDVDLRVAVAATGDRDVMLAALDAWLEARVAPSPTP